MIKPLPVLVVVAALASGCSTTHQNNVEHRHAVVSVQQLSDLGLQLGRNFNRGTQQPTSILVAPAIKHDGQLRPSQYGETLATQVTAGLVQSGLQVVESQQTGWTSGKPVVAVAKERAALVNANVVALGSYHHVGHTEIVAYRLVDVRTGRVLSFAETRFSGDAR